MNITVGQFNVKSKDIQQNVNNMIELIQEAIDDHYEMIVFGEYALTGYGCASLFQHDDFYLEIEVAINRLKTYSDEIIIIFGTPHRDRKHRYVAACILDHQDIQYSYKENLNKREFDETIYFTSKKNIKFKDYLITFKSDYMGESQAIVLDSSPVNQSLEVKPDTVYANTLGNTQVQKVVFINGGNSYVNNKKTYAMAKPLTQGLVNAENKVSTVSKLEALTQGIKCFSEDNFGKDKTWIVGNSGGLDSAVTLSLLTIALGKDCVKSYNLRSKFNSQKTVDNAAHLAKQLDIQHIGFSIDEAVEGYMNTLKGFGYDEVETLAYENIQARTRGHLLGGFSSIENAIISNNGNKLEIMLGYATLYGDTIGALSSIGDLVKIEVFELAQEVNDFYKKEVIPNNLLPQVTNYTLDIELPPTAELKSDQVDPMKWYYHDYLVDLVLTKSREEILEHYLNNQFKDLELGKWLQFYGLDKGQAFVDDFNWFIRTFEINNFKRMQMPPVLAYSNKVIGVDFLEAPLLREKSEREKELELQITETY